jgi:hypothetical protein
MQPAHVVALMRAIAQEGGLDTGQALLGLIDVLARTHATMDTGDWETIAAVGGILWRVEMEGVESAGEFESLRR